MHNQRVKAWPVFNFKNTGQCGQVVVNRTKPINRLSRENRHPAIAQAGGNSFKQYSVPQAVIKLRQGFGRLIRRRSDWGTVVVLDNRLIRKYYGKAFLKSLPHVPVVQENAEKLWSYLSDFYEERRSNS